MNAWKTAVCECCRKRTKTRQVERFEVGMFYRLCGPCARIMDALPFTRRLLANGCHAERLITVEQVTK